MRALVSTLLALALLLALAAGANGGQRAIYWLTFNEVGLDGHHRRVLSRHDIYPEVLALSPDHQQLAYVPYFYDGARSNKLWIADVHSPRERLILEAPSWITDLAWAPDGRTIALTVAGPSPPGANNGIWLVDLDGTRLRRVADIGYELAWSPDSESLSISRLDDRLQWHISVLSVETGVTHDVAAGFGPRWSPDGKSLLFAVSAGREELLKIRIVPAAGGQPRTVARGLSPSWSRNGKRIAFLRPSQNGPTSLWIAPSRGGRARLLANDAAGPVWSPGSRWIAFQQAAHYCGSRLAIARADGGRPRPLATASRIIAPLTWSRGGRKVLYLGERCSNQ